MTPEPDYEEFAMLLKKQFELMRLVDHYHGEKKVELLTELVQVESQLYRFRDRKDFLVRFVKENPKLG
ncbi:MAG: hypothetical protein HY720_03935 [Planctomycetes bacterium]|nr:hypothetical protein [Planctomycetota bacterium]